ncbi:extracellular solute-binding protein [Paenibacillaceae bacterium]|nr:extracellular solute-binding protein [Paenibacillaceae bacterium]
MQTSLKGTVLLMVILTLIMAGCSGNGSNTKVEGKEGENGNKSDTLVTITGAKALREVDKLRNGDTPEDNPMTRWMADNLNAKFTYKWLLNDQNDALDTKIRLALASGEKLPDLLFISSPVLLDELIESGSIMAIDEAFDQYATERTKQVYENNPDAWLYVTKNGKRWGLPEISNGVVGDPIMWVRQDWLDAVGMQPPTTLEEVEAVMAAFKEEYPDKVAVALSGKNKLGEWMGDIQFLFGDTQPAVWNEAGDGTIQFGSIQPTVKKGLVKLKEYLAKGYIDSEFSTHDAQKAASLFTSGEAGIIFGPGWMGGWPLSDTAQNVPDAVVKAYPLPSGVEGKIGRIGSPVSYGQYVFSKDFEHMDVIFQYWDAILGKWLEDPESPFAAGWAEGYDYIMKDGEPSWTDIPGGPSPEILNFGLLNTGNTPPNMIEGPNIYERVTSGKIETIYEKKLAEGTSPLELEAMVATFSQPGIAHRNMFFGSPTPTIVERWAILEKMESEVFLKIIYGQADESSFDKFAEEWKEKGGDKITQEVNEWYKSFN